MDGTVLDNMGFPSLRGNAVTFNAASRVDETPT
jgi:hypothetical protein